MTNVSTKSSVLRAAHALISPANVERISQALLVVGADIEQNRQTPFGADAAEGGVEGHLANGNAHAAGALVAQSQDAFAIAYDNAPDVIVTRVRQNLLDAILVGIAKKEAARPAPNLAELLAGFAHRGRVNDRKGLLYMLSDQRVKKRLIGILEIAHETVFFDRCRQAHQPLAPAQALLLEVPDVRRQQTVQGEFVPFALGKGGAFVEPGIAQEIRTLQCGLHNSTLLLCAFAVLHVQQTATAGSAVPKTCSSSWAGFVVLRMSFALSASAAVPWTTRRYLSALRAVS